MDMERWNGKKLSLFEAVSLAVGTMIGAGIFSILGVGAKICGNNLPIAFFISALVSILVGYSYAKLGSKYVSNAGPIEFILRGVGDNSITGALSILMWFSYVISISLFAKAFSGYFLALFNIPINDFNISLIEFFIIFLFTILNFFGSKVVGRAEFFIVLIKVSVLLFFVFAGVWFIKLNYISPDLSKTGLINTFYASSILFLTYMGFGLITNASENIENPKKNVPLAIYLSILIVSFIYISVSVVALGNLGVNKLIEAKEYALAEATKSFLGEFGFVLVSIGALFSTSSAINSTMYGGANIAYALAKKGELPEIFERKIWFDATEGLYITSVLSLLFALFFNLNGIANLISTVFLIIYVFVIISHIKLLDEVDGNKIFMIFSLITIIIIFLILMKYQFSTNIKSFYTSLSVIIGSFIFETVYRRISKRNIKRRDYLG